MESGFSFFMTALKLQYNHILSIHRDGYVSTLPAGYIPQRKMTSASSSRSMGSIVCVKCCMMVGSVPRWQLSLSWRIQSDHLLIVDWMLLPLGLEHSHGKTQYIPGKQVLVRSRLWIFLIFLLSINNLQIMLPNIKA